MKNIIICSVGVFISWSLIDFLVHGIYLKEAYMQTADLWRPEAEIKMILNTVVVLLAASIFTLIYALLVDRKTTGNAMTYGLLMGLSAGITMGYGFYAFSPIPYSMAATWFVTAIVEGLVAGILLARLISK